MTARVSQIAALVLADTSADPRVSQVAVLVMRSPATFGSELTIDYALEETPDVVESDITFTYVLEQEPVESDIIFTYALESSGALNVDVTFDYGILSFFATDVSFSYELLDTQESRVTQLPILSLSLEYPAIHVTQLPIISVVLPEQNTHVTQLPILTVVLDREVPYPRPRLTEPDIIPANIIPNVPISQGWSFLSVIVQSQMSREQRVGLRGEPRYDYSLEFQITDPSRRREFYSYLYKLQHVEFLFPMYEAFSRLTQTAEASDTRLYLDPSKTDLRVGEAAAIFDPYSLETTDHVVAERHGDGVTLQGPVGRQVGLAHAIAPAPVFRAMGPPSMATVQGLGTAKLSIQSTRPRAFERVDGSALLTRINGMVVLMDEPFGEADEAMDRRVTWIDSETSIPKPFTHWTQGLPYGVRSFRIDRETDMDYWRAFAKEVAGRQRAFLAPTWMDDLPLSEQPALGSDTLVSYNVQAHEYLKGGSYTHLWIQRQTGTLLRRIQEYWLVYDEEGMPVQVAVKLDGSIGNNPGDNFIHRTSFLNKVRLDTDTIQIDHFTNHSVIKLPIQGVSA